MVFNYEALDDKGNEVKDAIEAVDSGDAIKKIRNKDLFPTKVVKQKDESKGRFAMITKAVISFLEQKVKGIKRHAKEENLLIAHTVKLSTLPMITKKLARKILSIKKIA